MPDQTPPYRQVGLCAECDVGEHLTCDDAAWRENGLCGCTDTRHEREQQSYEAMVERGAAALGTWINAKYPPAWAAGAARVVLNAALAHPSGSAPQHAEVACCVHCTGPDTVCAWNGNGTHPDPCVLCEDDSVTGGSTPQPDSASVHSAPQVTP